MTRSAGSRAPATRRSVWILFSSRPLSAALAKTWFRVLFAAAAALALTDGVADLRAAPPAPAGRYFRLTPADPRHAFVASPPPVDAPRPAGGEDASSPVPGAARLAAETVRLVSGRGRGGAEARRRLSGTGLVVELRGAAAADRIEAYATHCPAAACVALQAGAAPVLPPFARAPGGQGARRKCCTSRRRA